MTRFMANFDVVPRMIQLAVVGGLFLLWWMANHAGWVAPFFLPPPGAVFAALGDILSTGAFVKPLLTTAYELVWAFLIAAVLGWTVGYLVSRTRYSVNVMEPIFAAIFTIPAILFYPLYVLIFGVGPESKIAIGATIAFFPIVLSTISGLSYVNKTYVNAARSMGASQRQLFFSVMLPAAAPVLVTGLRIGCTLGYLVILGAETLTARDGLGRQIVTHAERMNIVNMYAFIFIALTISLLFTFLLSTLENLVVKRLQS